MRAGAAWWMDAGEDVVEVSKGWLASTSPSALSLAAALGGAGGKSRDALFCHLRPCQAHFTACTQMQNSAQIQRARSRRGMLYEGPVPRRLQLLAVTARVAGLDKVRRGASRTGAGDRAG